MLFCWDEKMRVIDPVQVNDDSFPVSNLSGG